ncbi:hypothetical protein DTL42_17995 [Bremerella cremea]|uniref:Uncharacterized protein n=2 Tax=Bremerella cremea TaxID=1031537 RepID=A0A368KRH5_9BACT|nr:hypothetical protein DTL42_17995 [Bremerella cremea]
MFIPLAIGPLERADRFEYAICDLLEAEDSGYVVGSGTYGSREGISGANIQIAVATLPVMNRIIGILRKGGAPPESTIEIVDESKVIRLEDWGDL